MAVAGPGQLNLDEVPAWGSRSVDCFEKLEQIGEGTYGLVDWLTFPRIPCLLDLISYLFVWF